MPDRGIAKGPEQWKRASTHNGGMELDIMEHLSGWGIYRFNQAFHWDGYGPGHKAVGSTWVYTEADKDDFIVIGMLWLPGVVVYYSNGQEIGRFESERVCDQQSMAFFYMVSGGWANTPLDDDELADPAFSKDFVVDYFRVWQRNDLATPADGFQPNDGRWRLQSNDNPGMQITEEMRRAAAQRNARAPRTR
jgi:beta-glucanase (GH16 family)